MNDMLLKWVHNHIGRNAYYDRLAYSIEKVENYDSTYINSAYCAFAMNIIAI